MIDLLIGLTIRGSAASIIVVLLDKWLSPVMLPRWRRSWWFLAALAWVIPDRFTAIPVLSPIPAFNVGQMSNGAKMQSKSVTVGDREPRKYRTQTWLLTLEIVWAFGGIAFGGVTVWRTIEATRRWNHLRLCTDNSLLEQLEDCKKQAGVTTPVALVVTKSISTPAIFGWLRPRLLLPDALVSSTTARERRAILFHELAHLNAYDIPGNWLFSLVLCFHWYNPIAHLALRRWRRYCEIAADSVAMQWIGDMSGDEYGRALVKAVTDASPDLIPQNAFALGESYANIRERIGLVTACRVKARMAIMGTAVALILLVGITLPERAVELPISNSLEAESAAVLSASTWLSGIDSGRYDEGWISASHNFKSYFSPASWKRCCIVNWAWGKSQSRKVVSTKYQGEVIEGDGRPYECVVVEFEAQYAGLGSRKETIWMLEDRDSSWSVGGILLNP